MKQITIHTYHFKISLAVVSTLDWQFSEIIKKVSGFPLNKLKHVQKISADLHIKYFKCDDTKTLQRVHTNQKVEKGKGSYFELTQIILE